MGLHFHYSQHEAEFIALCEAGKVASCTIIDNTGLCERIAPFVQWPVLRWFGREHQGFVEYGAQNSRIIYQFDNEQNDPFDVAYYMDILTIAIAKRRRVVLFNDSVGATTIETWLRRKPVLRLAKISGFGIAATHLYGDVTKGDNNYCPMLDPAHPGAFPYFDGRIFGLYDAVPEDCRPPFIATEAGAGGYQLNASEDQWVSENVRFNLYVQNYEWFKAFNKWTETRIGMGFDRDMIDPYVHRLAA